jgi:hypothetical protein
MLTSIAVALLGVLTLLTITTAVSSVLPFPVTAALALPPLPALTDSFNIFQYAWRHKQPVDQSQLDGVDLLQTSIGELKAGLAEGRFSVEELVEAYLGMSPSRGLSHSRSLCRSDALQRFRD